MLKLLRPIFRRLISHRGFCRYLENTSWSLAEKLLRIIAGIFVGVWVARYLGPEQYGIFNYIVSFVAIFGSVAKLGLDEVVVRDLVQYPDKRVSYLGTAFWMKLAGGLFSIFLAGVAAYYAENDGVMVFYALVISAGLIFQALEVVDYDFQSRVLMRYVSICRSLQLFISSIIKLVLVVFESPLEWFFWLLLLDQIILYFSLLIAYVDRGGDYFFMEFNPRIAKHYLSSNWPLMLSGLMIMIYMRIDQLIIKELLGDKNLGNYVAATKLSEALYFVPVVISTSLFPAIVSAKNKNVEGYVSRLQRLYGLMIFAGFFIALPTTIISDWLVTTLYGVLYEEAAMVLMIHIWACVFVFLGVASNNWLIIEGLQIYALYRLLAGVVVNVLLNVFLIPIFGIIGAAISAVITQAVVSLFSDLLFQKTRNSFWVKLKSLNFIVILYHFVRR